MKNISKGHKGKKLLRKELQVRHKDLLYKYRLGRLLCRWNSKEFGSYIVNKVIASGSVEVKDPEDSRGFTMKGKRLQVNSGSKKGSEKVSMMPA